jgi:hypothetical protein
VATLVSATLPLGRPSPSSLPRNTSNELRMEDRRVVRSVALTARLVLAWTARSLAESGRDRNCASFPPVGAGRRCCSFDGPAG